MKKSITILISMMSLTVALAIGSFAWYRLPNDGLLSTDVNTKESDITILFNETQTSQSAIIPAKLKKGVINGSEGNIIGDTTHVPLDRDCLPKTDENFNYIIKDNKYETKSEYLTDPAAIVYNQFNLQMEDKTPNPKPYDLRFFYTIKYFNVDDNGEDLDKLQVFRQKNALAFNFFFIEGENGLTKEQLKSVTTADITLEGKKTIENVFQENASTLNLVKADGTGYSDATLKNSQVADYRFVPQTDPDPNVFSYEFTIAQLKPNTKYNVVLESYYQIPGALVEGNLPLTGRFIIDIGYEKTSALQNK